MARFLPYASARTPSPMSVLLSMPRTCSKLGLTVLLSLAVLAPADASERLDQFLPATTKGFVSFPDIDRAIQRWDATQLGKMMADPVMKPFVDEIRDMFQGDVLQLSKRLGVHMGQLQELRGGEVCLAFVQPQGDANAHAAVLLMDIRGREQEAAQMLKTVAEDLQGQGAAQTTITASAGVQVMVMTLPNEDQGDVRKTFSVIHQNRLFITDRLDVANRILSLMEGRPGALSEVAAFRGIMKKWNNQDSDVRWFIEPFGLVEVLRASQVTPNESSIDVLQVLSNQGFRAIEGIGGHVRLATGKHELLHQTMIYAPGKQEGSRFESAARMLSFPNSTDMTPLAWIPSNITTHITMRWDVRKAFEFSKSLVNEVAGEQVFDEILENIKTDINGPQIDIRRDLIAHFSDRITIVADHSKPIDADSERVAVAIELTNEQLVREAIDRAMGNDPKAQAYAVGNFRIWEMGQEEEEEEDIVVTIDDPFAGNPFGPSPDAVVDEECEPEDGASDDLLSNVCFAVAHGQLFVSKKLELLKRILQQDASLTELNQTRDFAAVGKALQQLGSHQDSLRLFVRTAAAYEPAYELLRTGQMAESNSLFGQFLNRFAQPSDPDRPRIQKIDGATMPPFDAIRHYLGPAGLFMVSTDEGWVITGCLLQSMPGA